MAIGALCVTVAGFVLAPTAALSQAQAQNQVQSLAQTQTPTAQAERFEDMTGRQSGEQVVFIELTLIFNGQELGAVGVETSLSSLYAVDAGQLADRLTDRIDAATYNALLALVGEYVSVETLSGIGIEMSFNPATLSISAEAPAPDASPFDIAIAEAFGDFGRVSIEPANFSAGLTSSFRVAENINNSDSRFAAAGLSGYANWGGIRGLNLDVGGDLRILGGNSSRSALLVDRAVLFKDQPERAIRYQAGTLFSNLSQTAGFSDFLGVGISKNYSELQPARLLRPFGNRSFLLERPGEVIVLVNGNEVSRFQASAGPVNLSDIPLADVSNQVTIVVEDEFGRRIGDTFSVASDVTLLRDGFTEYFAGIGKPRQFGTFGLSYDDTLIATGNIRRGISEGYTQGGFAYLSEDSNLVGAESVFTVLGGLMQLGGTISDAETLGTGWAAGVDYRWSNTLFAERGQDITVSLDYFDANFTPAGSAFSLGTEWEGSASYQLDLSDRLRLNATGQYQTLHGVDDPTIGATVGASIAFDRLFVTAALRYRDTPFRGEETGIFINLSRRLGRRHNITASYDSLTDRSAVTLRRASLDRLNEIGYSAELAGNDGETELRADINYSANRYNAGLRIDQFSDGGNFDGDTLLSATLQTGIAFADGKFGIGRDPGRGFYLVDRHPSLKDADVLIGSGSLDFVRAKTDAFGPAVSPTLSAFLPETVELQLMNAPIGYNAGESRLVALPGARSGYRITVGDDNYRSVVARFRLDGEPLSLQSGILTSRKNGSTQIVFTNRTGRTAISNLAPGDYSVEFPAVDLAYTFTVGADSDVFRDLGNIELGAD